MRPKSMWQLGTVLLSLAFTVGIAFSSWVVQPQLAHAQSPQPTQPSKLVLCAGQTQCDELGRTRLVLAYEKAALMNQQLQALQTQFQATINDYQEQMKDLSKIEGRADGTTYQIDSNGAIKVIPPPPISSSPSSTPPTPSPSQQPIQKK